MLGCGYLRRTSYTNARENSFSKGRKEIAIRWLLTICACSSKASGELYEKGPEERSRPKKDPKEPDKYPV